MFQRRAKILLLALCVFTFVLVLRSLQLQVLGRSRWEAEAVETMKRSLPIETVRGTIRDVKGRELAIETACVDAAVDYRAVQDPPDAAWVREQALARLLRERPEEYRAAAVDARAAMRAEAEARVREDVIALWRTLAEESRRGGHVTGAKSQAAAGIDVAEVRRDIILRVEMRRRYVGWHRYRKALREREGREPPPWYARWILEGGAEGPGVDAYLDDVGEQRQAHPVLRDIDNDQLVRLKKNIERYPGLALIPGTKRKYPYGATACHVIGQIARVTADDIKADPEAGDELRRYQFNDLIGRRGLEALCEPVLRGVRGRIDRILGEDRELARVESTHGGDVTSTIDIELQADLERALREALITDGELGTRQIVSMNGAAIVLDVATNEVRALSANPGYDLNDFDELYEELRRDPRAPWLNRATQVRFEPGSTVKPIIGIGAVTDGLISVEKGIECRGFLYIGGRRIPNGRCWVASKFFNQLGEAGVAHHPVPYPHQGRFGNPDGHLCLADALERSCNVYFETLGNQMGFPGLNKWFDAFGLGRETGIGIEEVRGMIPGDYRGVDAPAVRWFSAIGQTRVLATPIQMANVAATIARGGIWMRPKLVAGSPPLRPILDGKGKPIPDRVDLKVSPAAVAAAQEGMFKAVNSQSGTGTAGRPREGPPIAGKTGTAEIHSPLKVMELDALGRPRKDERGRILYRTLIPASGSGPSENPWYRVYGHESNGKHAWFIGFAPAERPRIAFAVVLEWGGSGGANAGPIVQRLIDACARHGYLGDGGGGFAPASVHVTQGE